MQYIYYANVKFYYVYDARTNTCIETRITRSLIILCRYVQMVHNIYYLYSYKMIILRPNTKIPFMLTKKYDFYNISAS